MPRPKRTKVASTAAPTRVARPQKPVAQAPQPPQNKKSASVLESFSDDSDGLVVKATRPRRRMPWQPEPQEDADLTMTGALPATAAEEEEEQEQETEPSALRKKMRSPRRISSHTPSSSASKISRSTRSSAKAAVVETSPVLARPNNGPLEDEESSLLDPSLLTFGSLGSSSPQAHGTRPPSAIKVGGTPAHETSILALTNFRRRARQPSLLRMVHQTTDVEDNLDFSDLDDFHPDDESTPLHVRNKDTELEGTGMSGLGISSSGSRGKKRKLSSPAVQAQSSPIVQPPSSPVVQVTSTPEVQVPRSSPPPDEPAPGADIADTQRSSSLSLPDDDVIESLDNEMEDADPKIMSETMAPPRSSSPPGPVDEIEDSPAKPRRGKKRGGTRQDSDSEGDETDRRTKAKSKSRSKAQTISTAKLQALLPRRRRRVPQERDEYDVQSSDDITIDSDQDELQLPAPRQPPSRKLAATKSNKKTSRAVKKITAPAAATKKNTRTYGRRSSDKENGGTFDTDEESDGEDEPTETSINAPTSKLAAIAKKFEDVDAWEMDFESVDAGEGNSSPWR